MTKRTKTHHVQLRFSERHYKLTKLLALRHGKSIQGLFESLVEKATMDEGGADISRAVGVETDLDSSIRDFLAFAPEHLRQTVQAIISVWAKERSAAQATTASDASEPPQRPRR